jgi:hypothetical protein
MDSFNKLIKDESIKNHPWLKNSTKKWGNEYDSLKDIFSMDKTSPFYRSTTKDLSTRVREASMAIEGILNQFELPMRPVIRFTNQRNVKYASQDEQHVVAGQLFFELDMRTKTGVKRTATIAVDIHNDEVIPPSTISIEGSVNVLSQKTLNDYLKNGTSYYLPPVRKGSDPLMDAAERNIAVANRNEVGWKEVAPHKSNYLNRSAKKKSFKASIKKSVKNSRTAKIPFAVPTAYSLVMDDLKKAEKDQYDTFPRSYDYLLRNYILEHVSTASKDAWMIPLINDGYCLNPYGNNVRVKKTSSSWEELEKRIAQDIEKDVEMEIIDEPVEVSSMFYAGTKTPIEMSDGVKWSGPDGPIKGTIVEMRDDGTLIIKNKGYEYKVSVEDVEPLPSTFKKMYL